MSVSKVPLAVTVAIPLSSVAFTVTSIGAPVWIIVSFRVTDIIVGGVVSRVRTMDALPKFPATSI